MKENNIINGNCWVAYFDILGFSNMVESFPVAFVRKKFKDALKVGEQFNAVCKFKFFSDSFIFYIENDSLDSFRCIRGASAFFFYEMFTRKEFPHFPMRGCLNVGKFYVDEENGIFFGQALIEACRLAEEQNWIGFVLSDKAQKKIKDYELAGFETKNEDWFQEYKVPNSQKQENLLSFKLKLPLIEEPEQLWVSLREMEIESIKIPSNTTCFKCKRIINKYINTEDYLLSLYPSFESKKRINQNEICSRCRKNTKN